MSISDIFLILLSSTGLIHGISIATYLFFFKKKKTITNSLIGLILLFMAFRIGKSVMLYFGHNLEPLFVFIGLSFLTLIGPLLKHYIKGMITPKFSISKAYFLEFVPFLVAVILGFYVPKDWLNTKDEVVIAVFGTFIISVYLHLAFYIVIAARMLYKKKKQLKNEIKTKDQNTIMKWLNWVVLSFVIIWISYFLNILDNAVPYIVGPIMYSFIVYYISIKAYQYKIIDLSGNAFLENKDAKLYHQICKLIIDEKGYLNSELSLQTIGNVLKQSKQKVSEIINQYSNKNFNDFINFYRVQDAKNILRNDKSQKLTIASIAFDVGFNSLSSFNLAFKKFEKKTPSIYRKNLSNQSI